VRTLTTRLVVTVVALLALLSLSIAVATTLVMRNQLSDKLDRDVLAAVGRAYGPGDDDGDGDHEGPRPEPGIDVDIGNQPPGTLVALPGSGEGYMTGDRPGEGTKVGADDISELASVPVDREVHTVRVEGDEAYRVTAVQTNRGVLVIGRPTADVEEAVESLLAAEAVLVLVGVGLAAAIGTILVRRQLAPLREVAGTAHRVAELPLATGEIEMAERVPARLTDERTEIGQVGSALNTMLDHVEASLESRHRSEQQVRQFVADASHELRTPLATIAGYTELARRQPAATGTALDKVEAESARMTSLVEDLLLLARLDAGRPLDREPVDLSLLLLEVVNDARVVDPERRWRVVLPDEPVEVPGDAARLHQVVSNLLTNARKYTPPGTTVTVTGWVDDATAGFAVHDDGPGFPADLVPHAFERFTRGDAARHRAGGAGLGLSLVEAIVTAHHGSVSLDSRPGNTTVEVRLPRR
jgi:two-component system OmpR family sensor kinase